MEKEQGLATDILAHGADASAGDRAEDPMSGDLHTAGFYEVDSDLVECLGYTVATSIISAESVLVIASSAHLASLSERLTAFGPDLERAMRAGRAAFVDADTLVESASSNGILAPDRLLREFGYLLERAVRAGRPTDVFQGITSALWGTGERRTALDLDARFGAAAARAGASLTCPYPMSIFDLNEERSHVQALCMGHAHVLPIKPRRCLPRTR